MDRTWGVCHYFSEADKHTDLTVCVWCVWLGVCGTQPSCSTQGYVLPEVEKWWVSPQQQNVPESRRQKGCRHFWRLFFVCFSGGGKGLNVRTTGLDEKARMHLSPPNNWFVSKLRRNLELWGQRSDVCYKDRKRSNEWPVVILLDMTTPPFPKFSLCINLRRKWLKHAEY